MRDCCLYTLFSLGQACYTKLETVTFRNPLTYLVYYDFLTVSSPKNDIRPRCPEHNLVASEPTAALQDTDASFQMNPQR